MILPPWFHPVAEDVAASLNGVYEHDVVDGLLALAVAFARMSPKLDVDRCRGLWLDNARSFWGHVYMTGWPRPEGMVRVKRVKPTGGPLSPGARRCYDRALLAIKRRKRAWQDVMSAFADQKNTDLAILCLASAARAANPSNIGQREWLEVVGRAWDEQAMEMVVERVTT